MSTKTTSGINGAGLRIVDADGDCIQIPSSLSLNSITTAGTVSAWVKYNIVGNQYQPLVHRPKAADPNISTFGLMISDGDAYLEATSTTYGTGYAFSGSDIRSPISTWNHIVGVYDGSEIRMYLNGVEAGGCHR